MSAAAIIAIAIGVVVVLAALELRHARPPLRRPRRRRAVGRDPPPRRRGPRGAARPTRSSSRADAPRGRARRARSPATAPRVAPVEETALAPWSPPDPEALGVSRRQFFNRATVTLTSAGLGAFAAAGFVAFLWPTATGGFGQPVTVGKLDDILETHPRPATASSTPRRPARGSPSTRPTPCRRRARSTRRASSPAWSRASSPSTRSARTSAAACPQCVTSQWFECPCHGSQYNQVGEKKAGPAPRGMDRFPRHGRRQRRRHRRHRRHRRPARRSAPTPPARRPRARTASPAAASTDDAARVPAELALAAYRELDDRAGDDVDRLDPPGDRRRRLDRLRPRSTPARRARRSARRSSWPPTASRTTTTRSSRAGASSASSCTACCCSSSSSSACRCTGSSSPSRQAGATEGIEKPLRRLGRRPVRPDRPTAASTAPAATAA